MRSFYPYLCLLLVMGCGRVSTTTTTTTIPVETVQNPNFDDGLNGWQTMGNVTVVDIEGVAGVTKAAMLTYDGHTPTALWQEIEFTDAMNLNVSWYELSPTDGWLQNELISGGSVALDNNSIGPVASTGENGPGGIYGNVTAGKWSIVWFMSGYGTGSPNPLAGPAQTAPGSVAKVTAVQLQLNAPDLPHT